MFIKSRITVLGEGAWGTAFATLCARNGHKVTLWCHNPEIAQEINTQHTNTRYMPEFTLPAEIVATTDIVEAVRETTWIAEAVPVQYLRSVITPLRNIDIKLRPWIILSKGIEQETLLFPSDIVADVLGYEPDHVVCVGPSFARDLMLEKPTGFSIGSTCDILRDDCILNLENAYVECDFSTDPFALQICAAFKNVAALLAGVSDGQGNGDNGRALVVTRCFQKLIELLSMVGYEEETAYSLGCFGDLFLTASSAQSRNYQVGKALGAGEPLEKIIERTGFTPESINTAHALIMFAHRFNVNLRYLITIPGLTLDFDTQTFE